MNILLLGAGGREHALAYGLRKSKSTKNLYIAPGNPGTESLGKNILLNLNDNDELLRFCNNNDINLVVIGPEQPLVDGAADFLRNNNIPVFGPDKKAAEIEGNKSFAKNLMKKYKIPTADFEIFNKDEKQKALKYLKTIDYPIVIKASGLAAGKGVAICDSHEAAENVIIDYFENRIFGESGETIVIEEFMLGEEASVFIITDGNDFILLPPSQDHKRIFDGDQGKNTGGMGAYTPAPVMSESLIEKFNNVIARPIIDALKNENRAFVGCLYAGLMILNDEIRIVEFNCRFGDPETQTVIPILEGDLAELFYSAAIGNINKNAINYNGGASVCVILASEGYPDSFERGFTIEGLDLFDNSDNVLIFHAGTKFSDDKIITNGGRVLGITSFVQKNDLKHCVEIAYEAVDKINFRNKFYRKDIAYRALKS